MPTPFTLTATLYNSSNSSESSYLSVRGKDFSYPNETVRKLTQLIQNKSVCFSNPRVGFVISCEKRSLFCIPKISREEFDMPLKDLPNFINLKFKMSLPKPDETTPLINNSSSLTSMNPKANTTPSEKDLKEDNDSNSGFVEIPLN